MFLVFGIFLVSYPLWRRKNKLSLTKTALIYTISTYFLYVAWYRISNSILYNYNYYVNSDVVYVSSTKALLGALPFVVIALALVIDELFIDSE